VEKPKAMDSMVTVRESRVLIPEFSSSTGIRDQSLICCLRSHNSNGRSYPCSSCASCHMMVRFRHPIKILDRPIR